MNGNLFKIRNAKRQEYKDIGELMVKVYGELEGFPKEHEQPQYYEMLRNVGDFTATSGTEILVAVAEDGSIKGAVVYFSDMRYYGSGGTAIKEKNVAGFRLLAVSNDTRGF